jgi:hypothetical protein
MSTDVTGPAEHDDPPDAIVGDALRALDIALIEWRPDSSYVPLAKTPRWFTGFTPWSSLPFLEHFVTEARRYLHDHVDGVLASAPFTVPRHDGELLLRARALKIAGRLVLVIERLEGAADLRALLREARQQALEHETAADKARAVHAPLTDVVRAAAQLRQVGLPESSQPQIDALTQALTDLQAAAAALPPARRRR